MSIVIIEHRSLEEKQITNTFLRRVVDWIAINDSYKDRKKRLVEFFYFDVSIEKFMTSPHFS